MCTQFLRIGTTKIYTRSTVHTEIFVSNSILRNRERMSITTLLLSQYSGQIAQAFYVYYHYIFVQLQMIHN